MGIFTGCSLGWMEDPRDFLRPVRKRIIAGSLATHPLQPPPYFLWPYFPLTRRARSSIMQAPPNTEEACHPKITWKADRGKQISIQNHLFIAQNRKRQRDYRQATVTAPFRGTAGTLPSCLNSVLPDVTCPGWGYREGEDMVRRKGKRVQEGEKGQDLSWVLDLKASARVWETEDFFTERVTQKPGTL